MPRKKTATTSPGRRKPKHSDYTERAYRYASEVAGAKHAPRFVRQQCADFADGYAAGKFPYDDAAVQQACWFFEGLPVPIGDFGTDDGRIKLAPPQIYWTAELFGRRDPDNPKRRRYTEFYLIVPRKAGKSTYGAALCLRELCDPTRKGALAQCGGRTKEHAFHVYDRAKKMLEASEELRKQYAWAKPSDRQLKRTDGSGARMVCETGNLKDGSSPVICTFDELHDCENPHGIEVMTSSFAATREPLLCKFTTAGYLPMSIGLQERELAIQNFRGVITLPNCLNLLYEWDEEIGLEDDDPRLWEAIHPMYHHTVEPNFYPTVCQKARVNENSRLEFDHKLLCKWMRGDQSLCILGEDWDRMPEPPPLPDAGIRRAWMGVDSAELDDLTSLTLLGELDDGSMCAWWKVLAPSTKISGRKSDRGNAGVLIPETLAEWHRQGWIEECGKYRIDFVEVAAIVAEWIRRYGVRIVAVDSYAGNDVVFKNMPDPFKPKMIRFKKYASTYTPPTKELLGAVEDHTLAVQRHPVARWCATNAIMDNRVSGTMLPKKPTPKSAQKIDALDSLIQAIWARQYDDLGQFKLDKNAPIRIQDIGYGGRIMTV